MDARLEEEGEKPDPNNIYFVDEIFGGVGAERVHPVGGAGLPRRLPSRGPSTASRAWTSSATLLDGKYHDVDSSAGHVQAGRDGVLPRRAG